MPSAVVKLMFDECVLDKLGEMWDAGPAVCVAPESMIPEKMRGIEFGSRGCMADADVGAMI